MFGPSRILPAYPTHSLRQHEDRRSPLGGEDRQKTRAFSELQSHYLFADKFGRPAKGNDKGKVEGLVGYARRNFMVPVPRVEQLG
jgi:transposase